MNMIFFFKLFFLILRYDLTTVAFDSEEDLTYPDIVIVRKVTINFKLREGEEIKGESEEEEKFNLMSNKKAKFL